MLVDPQWHKAADLDPPENALCEVLTPSGDIRMLRKHSNLWWLPDGSMYVYFDIVKWRLVHEER